MSTQTEHTTAEWRESWIKKSRNSVGGFLLLGCVLLALGAFMVGGNLGATGTDVLPLLAGVAMAVAGQALVLVAVVATGVRLGIDGAVRSR